MASGGAGSCNGVSAGNNSGSSSYSSSSSSTGTGVGRTADPMGVAKAGGFTRFLFFRLGVFRSRTEGILDR